MARRRGWSRRSASVFSAHFPFLPFKTFPWFRDATIAELTHVRLPSPHHLYWPGVQEVQGSNPRGPTISFQTLAANTTRRSS